jgi:hypothetical protein
MPVSTAAGRRVSIQTMDISTNSPLRTTSELPLQSVGDWRRSMIAAHAATTTA